MKLISIIVPIYNSEKYIERCINSLINQTYKKIEIILINDGSTDNSINICKNLAQIDKRIKVIDKDNQGVSVARNVGLENAHGDYVMFVDIDDWIESNTIQEMYNIIQKENVDIVKCNSISEFYNKRINNVIEKEICNIKIEKDKYKKEILKILSNTSKLNVIWGQLIKKEVVEKLRFENGIVYGEDLLFNVQCLKNATSIYFLDKCCYHYFINHSGVSRNYSQQVLKKKIQDILYIYPHILDIVSGWDNRYENKFEKKFIKEVLENVLRIVMVYEDKESYQSFITNILNDKNYIKCTKKLKKEDVFNEKYRFKIPLKLLYNKKIQLLFIYAKFIYKPIRRVYKYFE